MRLLLIDDQEAEGEILERLLMRSTLEPVAIEQVFQLQDALASIANSPPDAIILDGILPPYGGPSETLPRLRQAGFAGPVIVSSMLAPDDMPGGCPAGPDVRVICKHDLSAGLLEDLLAELVPPSRRVS